MVKEVLEIAAKYPGLCDSVKTIPERPLPIMSVWPEPDIIWNFYNSTRANGNTIEEATKFAVAPSIR